MQHFQGIGNERRCFSFTPDDGFHFKNADYHTRISYNNIENFDPDTLTKAESNDQQKIFLKMKVV